jgi:hypothetical protein
VKGVIFPKCCKESVKEFLRELASVDMNRLSLKTHLRAPSRCNGNTFQALAKGSRV